MSLIYFALLLGALIFFHEFGHFIVARACGVRVLEFSIGFGPQVASFERGDTVYRIGALPLGGYVKMLGADPMEELPEDEQEGSFGTKPLWQRTLVVLAGPVFNLILPLFVFFFLFMAHADVSPAVIGTLQPDGVADKAGLMPGDVITEIDGDEVAGWWDLQRVVSKSGGEEITLTIVRDGVTLDPIRLTPKLVEEVVAAELALTREVGRIQMTLSYRQSVVSVRPGGAAHASGLRSWDRIISVDGVAVDRWEYTRRDLKRVAGPVPITVLREKALAEVAPGLETFEFATLDEPVTLTYDPAKGDGTLGLRSAELAIYSVVEGSPEWEAGLRRGDEIVKIDGRKVAIWGLLQQAIRDEPDESHEITFLRGGTEKTVELTFEQRKQKGEFNTEMTNVVFGMVNRSAYSAPDSVPTKSRVFYAAYKSWFETKRVFTLTVASLAGLFTGRVGMEQMGGPIFIYEVASKTEEHGWVYFLRIMVWLSISLGLINLLPIPLLDGGHLMFFLIEGIKRGPVSLRTRQIAAYVGFSMIIMLMVLVFKNDIARNWDAVVSVFQ